MLEERSGSGNLVVGAIVAVVAALLGAAGVAATGWFTYASKDEEVRVHLVEIAIGILRADPKEGVAPARDWAIKVIEKNSGVDFSPEDKKELLHKPIELTKWKAVGLLTDEQLLELFRNSLPPPAK